MVQKLSLGVGLDLGADEYVHQKVTSMFLEEKKGPSLGLLLSLVIFPSLASISIFHWESTLPLTLLHVDNVGLTPSRNPGLASGP